MSARGWRLDPHFLPGRLGPLFALRVAADPSPVEPQAVLLLPPFGEEMNKCRPMMAAQARLLAQRGIDSLLIDLYGTGDSSGDFASATWAQWIDDLGEAWRVLASRFARVHVLAVRAGALFVDSLTGERSVTNAKLVLWQPIVKGADYWRQILRVRVAADSLRGERQGLSPQETLQRDGRIEIAGYDISAELAEGLSQSSLQSQTAREFSQVLWAETVPGAAGELSPGAARIVQQWRSDGVRVSATVVDGEPFWATTEIAMAPRLLDETAEFLAGARS